VGAGGEEGEQREEVGGEEREQHEEVEQPGRAEARQSPPAPPGGRHVQGHGPHRAAAAAAAPVPARAWWEGSHPRGCGVWVRRVRVSVRLCVRPRWLASF